jgi:uncharacterized protein
VNPATEFWPWWLGALTFTALVLIYWKVTRRGFGVSGVIAKVLNWREEIKNDKVAALVSSDQAAWEEALIAETRKEFGELTPGPPPGAETSAAAPPGVQNLLEQRLTWAAAVTFVASILAGGLISAVLRGTWRFQWALDPNFIQLRGDGWWAWAALLAGGMLVGFGTRMGGGCTTGHGLSGCSRLTVASLVATGCFFGTAIIVSLLLGGKL